MLDAAVSVLLLEDLDLDFELDSMTEFNSSLETSEPMLDVDVLVVEIEVSIVVQLSLLLGLILLLSSVFLHSKENDSEMAPP